MRMVDAAMAPAFRYIDVFGTLQGSRPIRHDAESPALAQRAGAAVVDALFGQAGYVERLLGFLSERPSMIGAMARSARATIAA